MPLWLTHRQLLIGYTIELSQLRENALFLPVDLTVRYDVKTCQNIHCLSFMNVNSLDVICKHM